MRLNPDLCSDRSPTSTLSQGTALFRHLRVVFISGQMRNSGLMLRRRWCDVIALNADRLKTDLIFVFMIEILMSVF